MKIKDCNFGGTLAALTAILGWLLVLSTAESVGAFITPKKVSRSLSAQELVEQSRRKYVKARFCKPGKLDPAQTAHEFAPLIVEELTEAEDPPTTKMGLVDQLRNRIPLFKPATVYFYTGNVQAEDQKLEQILFFWAYERDDGYCFPVPRAHIRGVRVILGPDGMPVLLEALRGGDEVRIFFVSKSLEEAAKKQFGAPLPGRHLTIERNILDTPKIFVADVLDDGPVPMGPYVYVDSSLDRNVTTVHCRCSASQFDDAIEIIEYQLLPAENLDAQSLDKHADIRLEKVREIESLDKLFRWPKM